MVSVPVFRALYAVQWSPLLTASALVAPMLGLLAVKPNLAPPLLAYRMSRQAMGWFFLGAVPLIVVSLELHPLWPRFWLTNLREYRLAGQYQIPILLWYGTPLALALLRWRRPEARLLLAMACVPQNGFFYDQLPLMLIPRNRGEMRVTSALSWLAELPVLTRLVTTGL